MLSSWTAVGAGYSFNKRVSYTKYAPLLSKGMGIFAQQHLFFHYVARSQFGEEGLPVLRDGGVIFFHRRVGFEG